jgi:hypothetical protein
MEWAARGRDRAPPGWRGGNRAPSGRVLHTTRWHDRPSEDGLIDAAPAATPTRGFYALSRRQLIGTLAALMLTLLVASLDQAIVGTAMPRIIGQLNGFERYGWVTTC